jgi:acyl-coenzyme A thioesterase PaaI-like protein
MPAMTPEDLHKFLARHFPQAAHLDLRIEHLDDTTIRVRLPTSDQHLMGRLGAVAAAVTTNLGINFMRNR